MKKTNQVNSQHQIGADPILTILANKMATEFEKNVTASKLSRWVGLSSRQIGLLDKMESESGVAFLNEINSSLLPELIECKDKEARLTFLRKELPLFMGWDNYDVVLNQIGQGFLFHLHNFSKDMEDVTLFMDIFKVFISLTEIYSDYEYKEKELRKAA